MRHRIAAVIVVLVIALVGTGVWATRTSRITLPWQQSSSALAASGTLEADEAIVAPRVSGLIMQLPFEAGATVTAGSTVARLDDRGVQLQVRQAANPASKLTFQLQAEDYTLTAPISGVVTRAPAHVGEMAFPGQALLAVADLSSLKLTLYVREADLASVRVGQVLHIVADPYPTRTFRGVVTSVNQQAEFTPRNVQTRSDRLNLVFGVEARIDNGDGALKPGMPVDATFEGVSTR